MMEKITYDEVCQIIGNLYIESKVAIAKSQEEAAKAIKELSQRITQLENKLRERDSQNLVGDNPDKIRQ